MFFNLTLILSLSIFVLGLILRVRGWLCADPVLPEPPKGRLKAALTGFMRTVFSLRLLALVKTFFLDVLLQLKTLRQSPFRWVMHLLIWVGFTLLLVFHAMDGVISEHVFEGYYPTLNPFYALRDILGGLVLVGVLMAAGRRLWARQPRLKSTSRDWVALILLAVIMVSGFALAGMKTVSKRAFDRMQEEYSLIYDKEESRKLEAFWAAEYGLKSSSLKRPLDPEEVRAGSELNQMYCADCHSRPQTAPLTYMTATALGPVAGPLDRINFAAFLWYVHFLFAFAALAYLPFSKFVHIFATPAHLLARAGRSREPDPANAATIRSLALDACMHCGACSEICAAGAAHAVILNDFILPSEKIALLRRLAYGRDIGREDLPQALRGMILCTNCNRCADACPAGIDLQPLWDGARERLLSEESADDGQPDLLSPLSFYRAGRAEELGEAYAPPRDRAWQKIAGSFKHDTRSTIEISTARDDSLRSIPSASGAFSFSYCYACHTCSSVCPIKDQYEDPKHNLDLLPHQIIHAVLLGHTDMALGSRMLWACTGCYQCQEQCPQGVAVTDVFFELKNLALDRFTTTDQG
jgi:heterodisulfide reductase subunit C/nitrate reductase gamma subunit